jgi:hypothetical protein
MRRQKEEDRYYMLEVVWNLEPLSIAFKRSQNRETCFATNNNPLIIGEQNGRLISIS